MSDHRSAGVAAVIYWHLAKNFHEQPLEVRSDRRELAEAVRSAFHDCDFNDDSLDSYEELTVLGLAQRCQRCKHGYTEWSEDTHGEGNCEEATTESQLGSRNDEGTHEF
jgi:hypothetical protein